jgi:diaminohydroxyphosphoribosylaminopyrimidine deaminase/5-amino-6-(5-phosphoribosylamino)uracil reductase
MTESKTSAFDVEMMAIALRMAERGLGATMPNPSVGAVIADEATGEVIARGVTAPGGRPHAETIAIATAGERARGATIYVTLEPCSHHGRTGPCADAIIAAGLKRAVVGIEDPDPRVSGRGLDRLRDAGIEVVRGVGAASARQITRGHVVRVTERRPFTTLKLALDPSGKIARGNGISPVWVTGEMSRAHGMLLRARFDAILVGGATVHDDDPELTCRLPGLLERSPIRLVLSGSLDVPTGAKLIRTAATIPTWVMTAPGSDPQKRTQLMSHGARIHDVEVVGGELWLPAIMEVLVAQGVTRLLVEGGPRIWRAFANAALIDEVILYMAGAPSDAEALQAVAHQLGPLTLSLVDRRAMGTDTMWRLLRVRSKEGR